MVELLGKPAEALVEIRRKGEAGQMLTRAQWTVVAYYVHQGSEAFSKNPLSRESYIAILKAFDAAHQLRARPSGQDEYYLGNLPTDCRPERSKPPSDPVTPELVRKTVAETVRRLGNPATRWTPTLAARNLYVLLDEEKLAGAAPLNEALSPYWPVLWRVAARGHYFERREPVRESERDRRELVHRAAIPPVDDGKFTLSFARGGGHDFDMLLSFPGPRADVSVGAVPDDRGVPGHAGGAAQGPAAGGVERRALLRVRGGAPGRAKRVLVPRSPERDHVRFFPAGMGGGSRAFPQGLGEPGTAARLGCADSRLRGAVMVKAILRSKSIGTKVTEEEYARLDGLAAAAGRSRAEWVRDILIGQLEQRAAKAQEETVLAELLGLRAVLLNLLFKVAKGEPMSVVNPYALDLTFPDSLTRTRRDHTKYLTLINSITLLHQHPRPVKTETRHGRTISYIEVTDSDIETANRLAHEVLGRSLDELPPQTRRLVTLIDEMVRAACKQLKMERADFRLRRRDIRVHTGWGDTQLKIHLHRLEELEYLLVHRGGRGQSFVYELLFDSQEADGKPWLPGL